MSQARLEQLAARAGEEAWLIHRGRFLDTTLLLEVGEAAYLLRIHRGHLEAVEKGTLVMPRWTFALRASQEAWTTFWRPVPPPGFHDLIAMMKIGALKLEGDQRPFFANLRYFKELLALPRASDGAGNERR